MSKKLMAIALSGSFLVSGTALAQSDAYSRLMIGSAMNEDADFAQQQVAAAEVRGIFELDSGLALSAAIGREYENANFEIELMRVGGDTERVKLIDSKLEDEANGEVTATSLMANGWLMFSDGEFRPFIGGGLGFANIDIDASYQLSADPGSTNDSDTVFAWQFGAGFEYSLSETTSLIGLYKHFNASGIEVVDFEDTKQEADFSTNIVQIGLKFDF